MYGIMYGWYMTKIRRKIKKIFQKENAIDSNNPLYIQSQEELNQIAKSCGIIYNTALMLFWTFALNIFSLVNSTVVNSTTVNLENIFLDSKGFFPANYYLNIKRIRNRGHLWQGGSIISFFIAIITLWIGVTSADQAFSSNIFAITLAALFLTAMFLLVSYLSGGFD